MRRLIRRLRWELKVALTQRGDLALTVFFFILVAALFPLGLSPEPALLLALAPGVIWISALLSTLLSLDQIWSTDAEDGTLDLHQMDGLSSEGIVMIKAVAHWLTNSLPIIVATPLLGLFYHLTPQAMGVCLLTLLMGTPFLSFTGTAVAMIALGARRPAVLLTILLLPLFTPVLILGTLALHVDQIGLSPLPHLLLLGSLSVIAITFSPWAGTAALRLHRQE